MLCEHGKISECYKCERIRRTDMQVRLSELIGELSKRDLEIKAYEQLLEPFSPTIGSNEFRIGAAKNYLTLLQRIEKAARESIEDFIGWESYICCYDCSQDENVYFGSCDEARCPSCGSDRVSLHPIGDFDKLRGRNEQAADRS
jgi:hypothetical protein